MRRRERTRTHVHARCITSRPRKARQHTVPREDRSTNKKRASLAIHQRAEPRNTRSRAPSDHRTRLPRGRSERQRQRTPLSPQAAARRLFRQAISHTMLHTHRHGERGEPNTTGLSASAGAARSHAQARTSTHTMRAGNRRQIRKPAHRSHGLAPPQQHVPDAAAAGKRRRAGGGRRVTVIQQHCAPRAAANATLHSHMHTVTDIRWEHTHTHTTLFKKGAH